MTGTPWQDIRWFVIDDAAAIAKAVVAMITQSANTAIEQHGRFSLVLAGGTTPQVVYQRLASSEQAWAKWQLYYGDERCLPPEHAERNSQMVMETGLAQRAGAHYPIPAELGAEAGAAAYAPLVAAALPFDMVLLGMGEDGHTASLFPGHEVDGSALVLPVHNAPKPPPDRISLSPKALQSCTEMIVMVTGSGKADALQRWLQGEPLPIAQLTAACPGRVTVMTDQREVLEGNPH